MGSNLVSPSSDSENLHLMEQHRFILSPEDNMNKLEYQQEKKLGPRIDIENYKQFYFKDNNESDP